MGSFRCKSIILANSMKKYLIITLVSLVLCSQVCSLETTDSRRAYCIRSNNNFNLDVQVYPELKGTYISFYNSQNSTISNLTLNISLLRKNSSRIINTIPIEIPSLEKNEIFCHFFEGVNFSYNEDLDMFWSDFSYILNDEKNVFHNDLANDAFRIDKRLEVANWKRIEDFSLTGSILVHDKIMFRKLYSGDAKLILGFKEKERMVVPHTSFKEAKISYASTTRDLSYLPSGQGQVSIPLDSEIPINEPITVDLEYELYFDTKGDSIWYPLSTFFYEINTHNIIPEEATLLWNDNKIENIKDVGLYSVEISIPKGFEYGRPKEEQFFKEIGSYGFSDDESNASIIYPSFNCLNISSVPTACILFKTQLTPHAGGTKYEKISWTSPIINGKPKKLSFNITENSWYRFLFALLLIVSIAILLVIAKYQKWYIESLFGCLALYATFRLFLPIPPFLNLFDTVIGLFVIIWLVLFLRKKETLGEYFCSKCNRNHNPRSKIYVEHSSYKVNEVKKD
jgi:hypothetical protein